MINVTKNLELSEPSRNARPLQALFKLIFFSLYAFHSSKSFHKKSSINSDFLIENENKQYSQKRQDRSWEMKVPVTKIAFSRASRIPSRIDEKQTERIQTNPRANRSK